MIAKLIAVQGMKVAVDAASPVPSVPVVATVAVLPPTGVKCKAGSALVHRDGDTISVSNITVPLAGATTPDPGPYVVKLEASAEKSKAEGVLVLVGGDISETIDATPKIPGPPVVDYPVSFNCIISDPAQTKAKSK